MKHYHYTHVSYVIKHLKYLGAWKYLKGISVAQFVKELYTRRV